jgi:hypothetical protein
MRARAVTPRDQQPVLVRPATGIQERTRVARHALTLPALDRAGKALGVARPPRVWPPRAAGPALRRRTTRLVGCWRRGWEDKDVVDVEKRRDS